MDTPSPSLAVPLRVDFAGGWLDVPKHARQGAYIVNMAIKPTVSLDRWPYERRAGLGGSAAWSLLNGKDPVASELDLGVGWQDPAVIMETGLCVWKSGPRPVLEGKMNATWLEGLLAVKWSGHTHDTPGLVDAQRDYDIIEAAGHQARAAALDQDVFELGQAMLKTAQAQLKEGMEWVEPRGDALGWKYCGGGHGGYVLYLFAARDRRDEAVANDGMKAIEPYEC